MTPDEPVDATAGLRVVRGTPDDAELAALVAAATAVAAAGDGAEDPASPRSAWMDRSRTLRGDHGPLPLGRGDAAWRHSLR
ncbi:acyl-CoA carboxylase epsilon subunit [Demequina mangrovi]|uniref:Acyl-CoA carboxylase epsilon subunit n=1 Tax=Demequina mangrovi TaxID=1043493 RepID=A0A1H6Y841_9MICO|nr:acyl-CoA carboxylase epsilon subunit [Demequina mangrovi]SEJ32935.1 Acyl-CoA carboxylase epsilon subunit [Demequina mangrovi]